MDQLRAMRVFSAVIEAGSFNKAATALRLSPAAVTRQLADLEDHLGARLINRTTRRLALTEIGELYLDKVRQILVDVEEAEALASHAAREPRGHVRVLVSPAFAVHQIAKHLPQFRARHPQVSLEITAVGPVETLDEGFDVSILSVRKPLDGEFVARRLARTEIILCASPDYLARRGRLAHPRDLALHETIVPPVSEVQRGLTLSRALPGVDPASAERFTLPPSRRTALATTHIDTMYAAALNGLGIAGLPSFVIEDALVEHALERVLPEWHLFSSTLWAAMPTRKHVPARTRAFVDFLVATFGGEDRDPWLAAAGCETTAAPGTPAAPRPVTAG